ncbi:MAG: hypothetical protein JWQ02_543 [Capsulimonas sp.]|nr:hypothetical protein [Capsulimonas sp.]
MNLKRNTFPRKSWALRGFILTAIVAAQILLIGGSAHAFRFTFNATNTTGQDAYDFHILSSGGIEITYVLGRSVPATIGGPDGVNWNGSTSASGDEGTLDCPNGAPPLANGDSIFVQVEYSTLPGVFTQPWDYSYWFTDKWHRPIGSTVLEKIVVPETSETLAFSVGGLFLAGLMLTSQRKQRRRCNTA